MCFSRQPYSVWRPSVNYHSIYLSICVSVYLSVTLSESQIREVWLENKFRMFWNGPEHCLERIILIEDEDDILTNTNVLYMPWLKPS